MAAWVPHPDNPCHHPVDILFTDPCYPPPPLCSRARIIRWIIENDGCENKEDSCMLLEVYLTDKEKEVERKNAEERKRRGERPRPIQSFPKFGELPPEIRILIWKLAIPRRAFGIDFHEKVMNPGIMNRMLPVPRLAMVCREARDVVFGMGKRVEIDSGLDGISAEMQISEGTWRSSDWQQQKEGGGRNDSAESNGSGDGDGGKDSGNGGGSQGSFVSFVLRSDITMYAPYGDCYYNPGADTDPHGERNGNRKVIARPLPIELNTEEVAFFWFIVQKYGPDLSLERLDIKKSLPAEWLFLREMTSLKTLCVVTTIVHLKMQLDSDAVNRHGLEAFERVSKKRRWSLLLDLFNDRNMAEACSLANIRCKSSTPRHLHGPDGLNRLCEPLQCLNCEREIWTRYKKSTVERFWLRLFADELNEEEYREVFFKKGNNQYNEKHPWVKRKLEQAPHIRPAVMFVLIPKTNAGENGHMSLDLNGSS